MATTVAILEAKLLADTRDFDRGMDKSDSKMGSLAKTMGKAGLLGGVAALAAGVKVGFGEFQEAQKVTAQTEAVIKSTGGVANVTAKQVDKLATSIMKKSGIDDEQIKTGSNMLLTFTGVRNEVGKGNKIFDQATQAVADMSVAMGKDMRGTAILVGKALQDPIKGATALRRVGVALTEEQKEQIIHLTKGAKAYEALGKVTGEKLTPAQVRLGIEMQGAGKSMKEIADRLGLELTPAQEKAAAAMMKGGQMAEAQKIILKELNKEFGGSAEAAGKTFAGQISIARETLNNFAGSMVEKAIPYLQSMFRTIAENAPKLKAFASAFIDTIKPALAGVYTFIRDNVVPVLQNLWDIARTTWEGISRVLKENEEPIGRILGATKTLLKAVGDITVWLANNVVIPVLKPLFTTVLPIALGFTIKAIDTLLTIIGKVRDVFLWLRDKGAAAVGLWWKGAEKPLGLITDAFEILWAPIQKIIDGIKWLIENIKKIPVPDFGGGNAKDLPDVPGRQGTGDGGLDLMGASAVMAPFAYGAAQYGLQVTSGLRPGAVTKHGTPSDHAKGKALDVAGSASGMAGFFMSLLGNRSVRQAFYDPRGSIFGGAWSSYREGGHSDHVHVATYDKGGYLRPGWNLAFNGTGRPEAVGLGMPDKLILDLGDLGIVEMVRRGKQRFERLNGSGSW